jgi:hypothetical protein
VKIIPLETTGDCHVPMNSWKMALAENDRSHFEDLPDELLVEILKYIPHDDYPKWRLVSRRFNRISQEGSLWKHAHVRRPITSDQLSKLISSLPKSSRVESLQLTGLHGDGDFKCTGEGNAKDTFSVDVLRQLCSTCPTLKRLTVNRCRISTETSPLSEFPRSATHLEFNECSFPRETMRWLTSVGQMENLVSLRLEGCAFVKLSAIFYLRSAPSLEDLSFRDCANFGDSYHFDFKEFFSFLPPFQPAKWRLKSLNLSNTQITNSKLAAILNMDFPSSLETLRIEGCEISSVKIPIYSRLEFVSFSCSDSATVLRMLGECAAHGTMREICAKGAELSTVQRQELRLKFPRVTFDLQAME